MLSILLQAQEGGRVAGKTAQEFGAMDTSGLAMIIIALSVVAVAFVALYITFKVIAKIYTIDLKNRFKKKGADSGESPDIEQMIPGETVAAISLALHLYYQQVQGLEDAVITFKNASKTYSPWSSKIYGLRKAPKN